MYRVVCETRGEVWGCDQGYRRQYGYTYRCRAALGYGVGDYMGGVFRIAWLQCQPAWLLWFVPMGATLDFERALLTARRPAFTLPLYPYSTPAVRDADSPAMLGQVAMAMHFARTASMAMHRAGLTPLSSHRIRRLILSRRKRCGQVYQRLSAPTRNFYCTGPLDEAMLAHKPGGVSAARTGDEMRELEAKLAHEIGASSAARAGGDRSTLERPAADGSATWGPVSHLASTPAMCACVHVMKHADDLFVRAAGARVQTPSASVVPDPLAYDASASGGATPAGTAGELLSEHGTVGVNLIGVPPSPEAPYFSGR
eukprot:GHVU01178167.1.p1 GENE.GHVU01178167.1~~GHVU01178167.1.p1  ORF type:complete len:313 (-),score=20.40 GHVU01178167.1:40-978(-)